MMNMKGVRRFKDKLKEDLENEAFRKAFDEEEKAIVEAYRSLRKKVLRGVTYD